MFCVILLVSGTGLLAGQLEPPPVPPSSDDSEVRWIRKTPPAAPLPDSPPAPLPDSPPARSTASVPADKLNPFPDPTTEPTFLPPADPAYAPEVIEAPAAESDTTLAELEQTALANNPTLVQAAARIRAAEGKCLQAGYYPNPTIGYRGEEIGVEGSVGQQGAFVGQEIVTAGKLRLRSAVAASEVARAEFAWQVQRARVVNDVRAVGCEVLVAQRIVEVNQELVRIGQQAVQAAENLLKGQEVSRVDLLQARIEADSAKLQLHDAVNRHLAAWRRLAALVGVPDMEPARLADDLNGELPELSWEESLRHLLAESPELAEAYCGVERARAAVARECAEWVPNLNVEAGVRYDDDTDDTIVGLEVGLPLPIFNRNQGNICRAQAQLVAAENEVRRIELTLQDRLATAFRRYANARHRAKKTASEILPNAKASLDLVKTGYGQGEHDYLTLLTAQRTYSRVNLTYLQSLLEYHANRVSIEGFLLSGGLNGMLNAE